MKNPVKKIAVKKQYSIPDINFFWRPLLSFSLLNLENFGSNGRIKELDNIEANEQKLLVAYDEARES